MSVARIGARYLIDLIWSGSDTPRVVVAGDLDKIGATDLLDHLTAALALNTSRMQLELAAMASCHQDGRAALRWVEDQARGRGCCLTVTGDSLAVYHDAEPVRRLTPRRTPGR